MKQNPLPRFIAFLRSNPLIAVLVVFILLTAVMGIAAMTMRATPSDTGSVEDSDVTPTREPRKLDTDKEYISPTDRPTPSPTGEPDLSPTEDPDEDSSDTQEDGDSSDSSDSSDSRSDDSQDGGDSSPDQPSQINVNLLGDVYADLNCSGTRDSGETKIDGTFTVNIFRNPGYEAFTSVETDSSGHYSWRSSIDEDDSLRLQPEIFPGPGYRTNPNFTAPEKIFSRQDGSHRVDLPLVPEADYSSCTGEEDTSESTADESTDTETGSEVSNDESSS